MGNVSKTARILGISRKTVSRAREGPLEDLPRRPKRSDDEEFLMIHVPKFPVVLLETLLREVDLHLLTFPFHLKSGTNVHASYPLEGTEGLQEGQSL